MNIQLNQQNPNFKGLYKYNLHDAPPALREFLKDIEKTKPGSKIGSIYSDGCLAVPEKYNREVKEVFKSSKTKYEYKFVKDKVMNKYPIITLLKKFFEC